MRFGAEWVSEQAGDHRLCNENAMRFDAHTITKLIGPLSYSELFHQKIFRMKLCHLLIRGCRHGGADPTEDSVSQTPT